MFEWIERKFKSAYLNLLEAEVKRLRDENRQLVNSLLASHGMQQIEGPRSDNKSMKPLARNSWTNYARRKEQESMRPRVGVPEEKHDA